MAENLPVDIQATYPDDGSAARTLHQAHHDALHVLYNQIVGSTEAGEDLSDFYYTQLVGSLLEGSGIVLNYDEDLRTITISSTGGGGEGGGLSQEQTEDIVSALIADNSDLDWSYDDTTPSLVATIKPLAVTNSMLAGSIAYSKLSLTGAILNADLAGSIALSKLATDPLARANHTGTQLASTISDFSEAVDDRVGALIIDSATLDWTYTDGSNTLSATIIAGSVTNAMLAGSIALSKLATDPLARANHTGTQLASTISDFSEAVDDRVGTLIVAGDNITATYSDGAGTLTIGTTVSDIATQAELNTVISDYQTADDAVLAAAETLDDIHAALETSAHGAVANTSKIAVIHTPAGTAQNLYIVEESTSMSGEYVGDVQFIVPDGFFS